MLRRTVSRTLGRTLLSLALAQTALSGCNAKTPIPTATSSGEIGASNKNVPLAVPATPKPTNDGTSPTEAEVTANLAMALDEGKSGVKDGPADHSPKRENQPPSTVAIDAEKAIGESRSAGVVSGVYGTLTGPTGSAGTLGHGYGVGAGRAGIVGIGRPSGYPQKRRQHTADPTTSEGYRDYGKHAWTATTEDHLSTFAADVDTASYTIARRKLVEGVLPPTAAVRVEEFVNYFAYDYPSPTDSKRPFAVHIDAAPSPFDPGRQIVRVGVTTKAKSVHDRKKANLVFLVDVSGSMQSPDKLDLAKRSLRILVDNLKDGDTVALVTYAGSTRVVLPATGLDHKNQILAAIEDLSAGGSTAMASGIDLAYQEAMKGLAGDAESRVIILSDGDANVGSTSAQEILTTIAGKVKEGVTLSTIGFGQGNYKDETMEQLANKGNGNNFYIDGLSQAKRVFQQQLGSTLEVVAQDVKLQVDFAPAVVARYRLIGYENRDIADNDFRNDKVDAGEIGAGHQVTALYEIELHATAVENPAAALATVRVRHKAPKGTKADEASFGFAVADRAATFAAASADFRFAVAVAAFADVLRGADDAKSWTLAEIEKIATAAANANADRKELVTLIGKARALKSGVTAAIAH